MVQVGVLLENGYKMVTLPDNEMFGQIKNPANLLDLQGLF